MKTKLLILTLTILLAVSGIAALQAATPSNTVDLIVFSDTHIGRAATIKSGSDNLTSYERYAMLLGSTNQYSALGMINNGDITDGWFLNNTKQKQMYSDYVRLSKSSKNPIITTKGNHDVNVSMYIEYFNRTTEIKRANDILVILLGSKNQDCVEWMNQGTTYEQYQINLINRTIFSGEWNATKYHFLFIHYTPDSKWWQGNGTVFGLPKALNPYYEYFTLVFSGHEGGPARVLTQQNATVIHSAHLGDGKLATDTYLTVKIDRSTNIIAVYSVNFVTGTTQPLFF